jgi:uncharacterized protein (TIGR02145 family)
LALLFLFCANLHAQVTIGGLTDPAPGALLDLNGTGGVRGGLLLSNVTLPNVSAIPESFPGVTSGNCNTLEVKSNFRGAIVYHTGENNIPAGVYVWNGELWVPFGGDPILYDAQGNDYTIGYFGDAGIWMTQNLRTTDYAYIDGTETFLVKKSTDMNLGSMSEPQYTFPGLYTSNADARESALSGEQLEAYVLLYNRVAASGRSTATATDTDNSPGYGENAPTPGQYYRGVCPANWHLPSDYEWSELEKEIALHPGEYSSQKIEYGFANGVTYDNLYTSMGVWRPGDSDGQLDTYWGRQMKSATLVTTTNPNGSSFSREKGGFCALLVGDVVDTGPAYNYGSLAYFWSGSSYGVSDAVYRYLSSSYTGVDRNYTYRGHLFSVRCKKD